MVSSNDPVESFFGSLKTIKDALSPLELGVRKAAKDFEHCWASSINGVNDHQLVWTQLNASFDKNNQSLGSDYRKKGLSQKLPMETLLGIYSHNCACNGHKVDLLKKVENVGNEDGICMHCSQSAVTRLVLLNGFVQGFPSRYKSNKKRFQESEDEVCINFCSHKTDSRVSYEEKRKHSLPNETKIRGQRNIFSIQHLMGFVSNQLSMNLHKFDPTYYQESTCKIFDSTASCPANEFNDLQSVSGFLGNLKFARMGGMPSSIVGVVSPIEGKSDELVLATDGEGSIQGTGANSLQQLTDGSISNPSASVEHLRSTLSTDSLAEPIELVPHLEQSSIECPDKKKLFSVHDFFRYSESEGRKFFKELDRDADGQVNLEDLEVAMRKRRLPQRYAREFMRRTRSHLFSKSFGWNDFSSLMEQKEPSILRAYTTLSLSEHGTLQKSDVLVSLENAGLPANEDNVIAMMRFLNTDTNNSISYGHFQNFMLLLPLDRVRGNFQSIWLEAATTSVAPPVNLPTTHVLKSALAGGISCAFSAAIMHPVDTIKTQVQASTLTLPKIISRIPQIGVQGLYKGSIPAIVGQFLSHGLRTGICETSKYLLISVAPALAAIQVESVSSFCGTFLGTVLRVPTEVLKQRLQAGMFDNVVEASIGTWHQDGLKGFFRGTGATVCREVPFYVAGAGVYAESKKVVEKLVGRELEQWETIVVGAISGGLTGVLTTPFDVIKTRLMTGSQSWSMVAISILRHEGPLAFYKGALPRFFWIAPLGAINFAGYELLRKAMD